jgi:hypothetical protein
MGRDNRRAAAAEIGWLEIGVKATDVRGGEKGVRASPNLVKPFSPRSA